MISPRHSRLSSRARSLSGVRYARVLLQDGQFDGRIEAAFGPAAADQRAAAGLFAGGDQRFAQPDLADGGIGRLGAEPGDDRSAGAMSRVMAASARACRVPRSGQVPALLVIRCP